MSDNKRENIFRDYWKGRRVFVTGHTGFVGCWLATTLKYHGADVIGFSLDAETGSLYEKMKQKLCADEAGRGIFTSIIGDLRDSTAVKELLDLYQPTDVFHIAAFGFVKECYDDPVRAFATNVGGTQNLLEAVRNSKTVKTLVVASTDKVYLNDDRQDVRFRESDPLGGIDPYSSSKTCEDLLVQSYYSTYLKDKDIKCVIIRPSNILGGGDHNMNRLIPGIFYCLGNGENPDIRNPKAVRPWQNIMDIVDAYLYAAVFSNNGLSIYNVGPDNQDVWNVGQIADYVSGLYGVKAGNENVHTNDSPGIEHAFLGLDSGRIYQSIGWSPIRSLSDTLGEIYSFYTSDNGENTYSLCLDIIQKYFNLRRMK